jgi:hypothetical protein
MDITQIEKETRALLARLGITDTEYRMCRPSEAELADADEPLLEINTSEHQVALIEMDDTHSVMRVDDRADIPEIPLGITPFALAVAVTALLKKSLSPYDRRYRGRFEV